MNSFVEKFGWVLAEHLMDDQYLIVMFMLLFNFPKNVHTFK